MANKKSNPLLEKLEEKTGQDLDGDHEQGESPSHKKKVQMAKKVPPMFKNSSMKPMTKKGSKASPGMGDKMCGACKKSGATSCSHM
jgi:hypothetical protein